jgi:hypothetical protein
MHGIRIGAVDLYIDCSGYAGGGERPSIGAVRVLPPARSKGARSLCDSYRTRP